MMGTPRRQWGGPKHARSLPEPCLAVGGFLITACGTGRGASGLAVPCPPETRRGERLRVRTGPVELCRHLAPEEEPSQAAVHVAEAVTTGAKRRRNFSLWEAWRALPLCRGNGWQSLRHVCQQGPTGDS